MNETDLQIWSRDNWKRIPEAKREECINHLHGWIPYDQLSQWKENGFGSDFHMFGGGMQIRNRLRDILKDDDLPPVAYRGGAFFRNWDDYYMGALDELMERIPEL